MMQLLQQADLRIIQTLGQVNINLVRIGQPP